MDYECWPLGDSALLLRFGGKLDVELNRMVHAAAAALRAAQLPGVRAIAPSYAALMLDLDLSATGHRVDLSALLAQVDDVLGVVTVAAETSARLVEIPVTYGGDSGPDLFEVAERTGLDVADVIRLHSTTVFEVAMLGFQPGFPYLLGLPEELVVPRRDSVRPRVAAGSVAIAGHQSGIYPARSPGGWHLIGRTDMLLFDSASAEPVLLRPGDRVRFKPCIDVRA
jgi:KipI family sensor histidine kinase inhibitor